MLTVRIEVDRDEAIKRGIASQGTHEIKLESADLAGLSPDERELLACLPARAGDPWRYWRGFGAAFRVVEPTVAGLIAALRAELPRLQAAEQKDAAYRERETAEKAERDARDARFLSIVVERIRSMSPAELNEACTYTSGTGHQHIRIPADLASHPDNGNRSELAVPCTLIEDAIAARKAYAQGLEAEAKRAKLTKDAAFRAVLRDVIKARGTPLQLARWNEGLCPVAEALDLKREEIFAPFDLPRYVRVENGEVEHTRHCDGPQIKTSVGPATQISDAQFQQFVAMRSSFPAHFVVKVREHQVWCASPDCEESAVVTRLGVLAETVWEGHDFSREYALDNG